jgi:uncharacterized protein YegL
MKNKYFRKNQKGMTAAIILLFAAILAMLSLKIIEIGKIGINVNNEKHLLDTCSIVAGQKILSTNDIDNVCSETSLQQCFASFENNMSSVSCTDRGVICDNENECKRNISLTSTYNPGQGDVTKSVDVYINEEKHEVNIIDAAVIFLLDFSGSMQGNRINQLKTAVRFFIGESYNLSYSVILYNSDVIGTSNIGKSPNHDQTALSILNNNNSGGGTNFIKPLQKAIQQINNTNHEVYYIVLISDGAPNEGITSSRNFVNNNIMNIEDNFCILSTSQNPCISIFTLGVDNADTDALKQLCGNTINRNPDEYMYAVSANQTSAAFNAIIEEIMCRVGPVLASDNLYVFNDLEVLEVDIDYVFDNHNKILKFYDEEPFNICTEMLNDNSNITLRWGNPQLSVQ